MKYSRLSILVAVCIFASMGISLLWSDEWALHVFTGSGWVAHSTGVFRTDVGNAGIISFEYDPTHPSVPDARRAYLFGTGIEGYFWSESTGWATFTGGTSIIPPDLITEGIREIWTASGYAWSEYAGWFTLSRDLSTIQIRRAFQDTYGVKHSVWFPSWLSQIMYDSDLSVEWRSSEMYEEKISIISHSQELIKMIHLISQQLQLSSMRSVRQ